MIVIFLKNLFKKRKPYISFAASQSWTNYYRRALKNLQNFYFYGSYYVLVFFHFLIKYCWFFLSRKIDAMSYISDSVWSSIFVVNAARETYIFRVFRFCSNNFDPYWLQSFQDTTSYKRSHYWHLEVSGNIFFKRCKKHIVMDFRLTSQFVTFVDNGRDVKRFKGVSVVFASSFIIAKVIIQIFHFL